MHLFHEIEYAHIIVFYLGLGLIIQGLALAIVNKEIKMVWKFSTEQTLEDVSSAQYGGHGAAASPSPHVLCLRPAAL